MQKKFLDSFEGKKSVWHIILDNGNESWITQEVSFADETCAKGACKLNTIENATKHVLFLLMIKMRKSADTISERNSKVRLQMNWFN